MAAITRAATSPRVMTATPPFSADPAVRALQQGTQKGASMATDQSTSTSPSQSGARSGGGSTALQSQRGNTTIADAVVTKVASIAAREVGGVHALGGGVGRALAGVTSRVGIGESTGQGVAVEVGEKEAAVDLTIVIDYGESVPQVSQAVRENVIKRIEGITGLQVTEVNVAVNDLYLPGDDDDESDQPARVA